MYYFLKQISNIILIKIFPTAPTGAVDDGDCVDEKTHKRYEDVDWFYENYGKLKNDFGDKFVVVKNKSIILNSNGIERLKKKAKKCNIDLTKSVVKFIPAENTDDYFSTIRAVKVLDSEMQEEAKDLGYEPDDIVLIIRHNGEYIIADKIDGSIVEWQRKNGMVIYGE